MIFELQHLSLLFISFFYHIFQNHLVLYCIIIDMITVFLRKTNGKGQKLQIEHKTTVNRLMTDIREVLQFHQNKQNHNAQFQAYVRGIKLNEQEGDSVQDLGIQNNTIIHILQPQSLQEQIRQSLNLKLILEGRLFEYQVKQDIKISQLKHIICEDLALKDEQDLTLSFLGVELENDRTIASYCFAKDVLISANVNASINFSNYRKTYTFSKESFSQESEGVPKITRQDSDSPRRKLKKTESMNIQPSILTQTKMKSVFQSVQLKKIEQKVDQSRNDSIINQSQQAEQVLQADEDIQNKLAPSGQWTKPRFTLDLLGRTGNQNIIQTESIMGDDEEESAYQDCAVQLIRVDHLREYTFQCGSDDTFQSISQMLGKLERVDAKRIKLLINLDEVSKSGMSNRSGKLPLKTPQSPKSQRLIKRHKSYLQGRGSMILSPQKDNQLKMSIVEWASRIKNRELSIEYQVLKLE